MVVANNLRHASYDHMNFTPAFSQSKRNLHPYWGHFVSRACALNTWSYRTAQCPRSSRVGAWGGLDFQGFSLLQVLLMPLSGLCYVSLLLIIVSIRGLITILLNY